MDIECEYKFDGGIYCCLIERQKIPSNGPITFSRCHGDDFLNVDVKELTFDNCELLKIPQGLTKTFPNLEALFINFTGLRNLRKKDLAEYRSFKRIWISDTLIEFLPGDLFKGFINLEEISFDSNKLKIIEPNILNGLNNLKLVDFRYNPNYHTTYSVNLDYDPNTTLEELKTELNQVFLENLKTYKDMILKTKSQYREMRPNQQQSIYSDIQNLIDNEKFKDFKIQVGDREFHVHKFLLTARSPTFAEIILNNSEVEKIDLIDIPMDIFEIILKFLYTNELPHVKDINDFRLFAAAGRLKIEELKNCAATHAMYFQLDGDNALEILKLSNKYEHHKLRKMAFDKIKEEYPKILFKDKWAMEPEFVEKIIKKFKKKEEVMKKLEKEFQDELLSD